ncbi:polyprenyl synthetase family protein [Pontibacillus sp. HMF3514]|uniref:polyprenyl synthetase family protein n=1 Tax=Pontibacillus sp. HMF3514 TaxID=2692425 RepID=UPI00131FAB63|nr:polyprenyl synthetase family protein [Pontibacillus sp. HMF3514]QHE54076.1 polyprenyl synthetase [Pontibacillus sp. HMF3514]
MSNQDEKIARFMLSAVESNFSVNDLKQRTSKFIEYKKKEGFSFASLTKLHYEMFGGKEHSSIFQACAAVEIMVLALDIFDDLQDQDALDKPWCQTQQTISMNIATGLLILSMQMLSNTTFDESRKRDAIQYMNQQVLKAVQGQHQDLQQQIKTEDDYLQMVHNKSGSLMACACIVGVSLVTPDKHEQVLEYATNFGIAAQIQNDIQDVIRGDTKNDLLYKKHTLPTLKLLEENNEYAEWARSYYNGLVDKSYMYENKRELLDWIRNSSSIMYVQVLKRVYQRKTIQHIEEIDTNSKMRHKLMQLIEQI